MTFGLTVYRVRRDHELETGPFRVSVDEGVMRERGFGFQLGLRRRKLVIGVSLTRRWQEPTPPKERCRGRSCGYHIEGCDGKCWSKGKT